MPHLTVTESEALASLKVLSKVSESGGTCQHMIVTYEIDGQQKTLHVHEAELDWPPADEQAVVVDFLRLRKQRGKAQVGVRIA